jgi:predicted RNase H-related nuclease YkuK (DUF458 family)
MIAGIAELVIPHADAGGDFGYEIHLDIGRKGITKDIIYKLAIFTQEIQFQIRA